ncbi:MAG: hypothetical protein AABY73_09165 [Pseudomonadota bacterium]
MTNRIQSHALARIESRAPITADIKQSHRLPPQVCALWVPDCKGYLASFSPTSFRVVESVDLAAHYVEDEATSAALSFREITGLHVAIRTYHGSNTQH